MIKSDDKILIKDKTGKFKTVSLRVEENIEAQKHRNTETQKYPLLRAEASPSRPARAEASKNIENKKQKIEEKDEKRERVMIVPEKEIVSQEKIEEKPVLGSQDRFEMPKPIAAEETMPGFYFDLEDEQEVSKFRSKEKVDQQKKERKAVEVLTEEVMTESGLNIKEENKIRLQKAINSRLNDVRGVMETKEVLERSQDFGGVGLSNEESRKICQIIEKKKERMLDKIKEVEENIEAQKHRNTETQKHPFLRAEAGPSRPARAEASKNIENKKQESEERKTIFVTPERKVASQEVKMSEPKPVYVAKPMSEGSKIPGRVIKSSQEVVRPREEREETKEPIFIKRTARVMGPVEELASYDLKEFRALGKTPQEIIENIKGKIEMLEDESFTKKDEGIKAWRNSSVYKKYVQLGQESMESKRPVKDLIAEKGKTGQSILSLAEFEAIADLNEELLY